MPTCRFCKKPEIDFGRLFKYGTRHYAHHACYLDAGKTIDGLHDWQVAQFPALALKDHGLLEKGLAAYEREQARRSAGEFD